MLFRALAPVLSLNLLKLAMSLTGCLSLITVLYLLDSCCGINVRCSCCGINVVVLAGGVGCARFAVVVLSVFLLSFVFLLLLSLVFIIVKTVVVFVTAVVVVARS